MATQETLESLDTSDKRNPKRQRSFKNLFGLLGPSEPTAEQVRNAGVEKRRGELSHGLPVAASLNARQFNLDWTTPAQSDMLTELTKLVWTWIQRSVQTNDPYVLLSSRPVKPESSDLPYLLELKVATKSGNDFPTLDVLTVWEASGLRDRKDVRNLIAVPKNPVGFSEQRCVLFLVCLDPWKEISVEK